MQFDNNCIAIFAFIIIALLNCIAIWNTLRWIEIICKQVVSGVLLVRKKWLLFLHVHCGWDDNNGLKLQQRRFTRDIKIKFLTVGIVNTGLGCLGRLWTFYCQKVLTFQTNLSQQCFSPFIAQGHQSVPLLSDIVLQTIFPSVIFKKYVKQLFESLK